MTGLLLRYNKVHNDALQKLEPNLRKKFEFIWGDLEDLEGLADLQSASSLSNYLDSLPQFDFVVIGDVFWPTGQNICKICKEKNIPTFFLQHGQWVYTKNKISLIHYPTCTFLFGDFINDVCTSWIYSKFSKCSVTGSPRYDDAKSNGGNVYLYFAPPVLEEIVHKKPSGIIRKQAVQALSTLKGIDKELSVIIQPHYREARVDWLHDMFPAAQFADPNLDPFKLVRGASKVIASRDSTSVLDAIAHRKIVALTDIRDTKSFFSKGHFGEFALESKNKQEFIRHANSDYKLKGNNYVQRAKKHVYLGDASTRIVELIYQEMYNVS